MNRLAFTWTAALIVTAFSMLSAAAVAQDHGTTPAVEAPHSAPAKPADGAKKLPDGHFEGDGHDHSHDAHDAAHGHEPLNPLPEPKQGLVVGLTSIVVFLLVLAFLSVKVWPMIGRGLDERANKIKSEIEAAELAQEQAKAALQEYERNLAQARAEAQKMLDDAKSQQQVIAAELKAKSEVELNQMREKAKRDIEAAKRDALNEIYNQASAMATSMAGKILKREIGPQDHQRLMQESLGELQSAVARNN